jgi:hypothetical protein
VRTYTYVWVITETSRQAFIEARYRLEQAVVENLDTHAVGVVKAFGDLVKVSQYQYLPCYSTSVPVAEGGIRHHHDIL